jgi:hypothetical protein
MVGQYGRVMNEPFHPRLKPHELPRATLVDLWDRTVAAHEHLSCVWTEAVSAKHGHEVARAVAIEGWPLRARGATPTQLFFDDLRFVAAAAELKPEMLTVASRDQASMPRELVDGRRWFGAFVEASKRLAPKPRPSNSTTPSWTGSPGRFRGHVRGLGIDAGFVFMTKAWRAAQGGHVLGMDLDAFDAKVREEYDEKTLALLWNHAAIAYMLSTDRWYTGLRRRYGEEVAQELEKDVWIDRGAAEYDLAIGQQAMGVAGDDVEALLRSFQFAPGEVGIIDVELQLHGPNHGTLTHHRCPAVDRLEHYDGSRLRHSCEICLAAMPISGEMLNPKIECKPLKIPPRRDSDDIACKWEYRLRDQS